MSQYELKRRVIVDNPSAIEPFYKKGMAIVMLSSHCTNWEWILARASMCYPIPIHIPIRTPSNNLLAKFIYSARKGYGVHAYSSTQKIPPSLLRNTSETQAHVVVGDQRPRLG